MGRWKTHKHQRTMLNQQSRFFICENICVTFMIFDLSQKNCMAAFEKYVTLFLAFLDPPSHYTHRRASHYTCCMKLIFHRVGCHNLLTLLKSYVTFKRCLIIISFSCESYKISSKSCRFGTAERKYLLHHAY